MKLSYDFRVSQFDPPRSQSGNNGETTTSLPGHDWEANITFTTTAKLQQLRVNSRDMTTFAETCNNREMQRPRSDTLEPAQLLQILRKILRRFMAVVVSSAFWKSESLLKACLGCGARPCHLTTFWSMQREPTWNAPRHRHRNRQRFKRFLLNHRRNRMEFPQREANIIWPFSSQNASQP